MAPDSVPSQLLQKKIAVLAENQDSFKGNKAETQAKKPASMWFFPHSKESGYGITATEED